VAERVSDELSIVVVHHRSLMIENIPAKARKVADVHTGPIFDSHGLKDCKRRPRFKRHVKPLTFRGV
jgi:hypothetical protein